MLRRWLATLRRSTERVVAAPPAAERADFTSALRDARLTADDWLSRRLATRALYTSIPSPALERLRQAHPAEAAATVQAAETILKHEFSLLGSGPFVPVDPGRAAVAVPDRSAYVPIDWYLDPVRALRFPTGVPYKAWKLYEMRPGNADVKYPWELARCQHFIPLGQAYRLSGDERFAREIADEIDDFVEANPVGIGVNWTCTMDIALRAVSWAIGLELVHDSRALGRERWTRLYAALFEHGVFIRGNLENNYEVTSNHFLSNVVGLWFLAAVFPDLPAGAEWNAFARGSLEQEIDVQVLPDGADFESSIPYHRLVAELFLGSARLAEYQGAPLSAHYLSRVRDMAEYLAAVTRPDGLMPQVGDADDGRLHVLEGWGISPQDGRHLLAAAGAMFDNPAWSALAAPQGDWEAAWWGFDARPAATTIAPPESSSRLFADAGVAIMRAGGHYLLVTNGIVGTKGFGNHKHNDQLSFEFHPDGVPLIVDPGSCVYTSDADARNRFRGTGYHSTLFIDGVEQNETNPEWLFRLFESAKAEHVSFEDSAERVEYVGRHHGYERLPDVVTHERRFRLDKRSGALEIVDRLMGSGDHELRWRFHLAPGVEAEASDERTCRLSTAARRWMLRYPPGLEIGIVPAAYSPSYGVTQPCLAVQLSTRLALHDSSEWAFLLSS
jgi:hypothetical protein